MPDLIPLVLLYTSSCECDHEQTIGNDKGDATNREEDEGGQTTASHDEHANHGSSQKVSRACPAQADTVGNKCCSNPDRQHHATNLPSNVLRSSEDDVARYVQSREEKQEKGDGPCRRISEPRFLAKVEAKCKQRQGEGERSQER